MREKRNLQEFYFLLEILFYVSTNIGGNVWVGLQGNGCPDGSQDSIGAGDARAYVRQTLILKASNYSSIYGNSSIVQPNSVRILFVIKY